MNKKILGIYFFSVLALFVTCYSLIHTDLNVYFTKILIVGFCLLKTLFFMKNVIKKEIDVFKEDIYTNDQYYYLILLSIFLIISSYGLDYFLLYNCDVNCFQPILAGASSLKLLWNSFYYSSMIFFWMGIADINVNCTFGQIITWAESMVTFFILSYGTFKFLSN